MMIGNLKPDFEKWATFVFDPAGFVREVIGVEPDEWQCNVMQDIVTSDKIRTAVRSCHGPGKTTLLAWLIIFWLCTRPYPRIACSAPTENQLLDKLWPEAHKWLRKSRGELLRWFAWEKSKIYLRTMPSEWFAVARAARVTKDASGNDQSLGIQGWHNDNMLFLLDEGCFDEKTEILTDRGWKRFCNLTGNEKVLTRYSNGKCVYERPIQYHKYHHKGKMYRHKSKSSDFMITNNHRVMYSTRQDDNIVINELKDSCNEMVMYRDVDFVGHEKAKFIITPLWTDRKVYDLFVFDMNDWAELVGWYITEGSIQKVRGTPYAISISQKSGVSNKNRERIINLIKRMELIPGVYKDCILINNRSIAEQMLKDCGEHFDNKRIPRYILNNGKETCRRIVESCILGDGYNRDSYDVFYSSCKQLMNDVQEAVIKSGYYCNIMKRFSGGQESKLKDGRIIKSKVDGYYSNIAVPRRMKVLKSKMDVVDYDGMVYCVTVPAGTIYTRRNGKCVWTGNSGVADAVYSSVEGALSTGGGSRLVAMGNPNLPAGWFYNAFMKFSDKWNTHKISYKDSPRVSDEWAQDMIDMYGIDHPWVRVRVLAEFPNSISDGLLSLDKIVESRDRNFENARDYVTLGADVSTASGANKTIFALARRGHVYAIEEISGMELADLALEIYSVSIDIGAKYVVVDSDGIGIGVVEPLAKLLRSHPGERKPILIKWHGSASANDKSRYLNARAELCWKIKMDVEKSAGIIRLPSNENFERQGCAIRYYVDERTERIKIASKKEIIKIIRESPDEFDATTYALVPFVYEGEFIPSTDDGLMTADEFIL